MATVQTPFLWPDHKQLPCEDGSFVKNSQEHLQSMLLTDSLGPVLQRLHPDERYFIGQDCGIYWRQTDPPERGAEAPDWYYVPDVPATLDDEPRRSYVLWREGIHPSVILEFASGDGSEERDPTPQTGKFWVYEKIIHPGFYGIFLFGAGTLEMYTHSRDKLKKLMPNKRGRYRIDPLQVELGVWHGKFFNLELPWLRWWDLEGQLLLTGGEQLERERREIAQTQQQLEQERLAKEKAEQQVAELERRARELEEMVRALSGPAEKA